MKNSYEVLSPFFLKFAGFCVSVFLCILCVRLFILNTRYAYWQANAFLVWPVILGAFILCVCFAMLILAKMSGSRVYLSNMCLIYCIKCILFLLIFNTRAYTLPNADMMLRIVLCFGILFIFLEFLHAQTSMNFIKEKTVLSGIMGITSCIVIFMAIAFMFSKDHFIMNLYILAYSLYALYALRIFVFTFIGKEAKSSILFKCSSVVLLYLWILLTRPMMFGGMYYSKFEEIIILETLITFCFTQLIPSKTIQTPDEYAVSSLRKLMLRFFYNFHYVEDKAGQSNGFQSGAFLITKGMFMLAIRFTIFAILATRVATIWRGI